MFSPQAICQLLEIGTISPTALLRHNIRMKLYELEADDKLILKEGMNLWCLWSIRTLTVVLAVTMHMLIFHTPSSSTFHFLFALGDMTC